MASYLNPSANPWFPVTSMFPHIFYHPQPQPLPPPQPYLQPPFSISEHPILLYNINFTHHHVPSHHQNTPVYQHFHHTTRTLNSHLNTPSYDIDTSAFQKVPTTISTQYHKRKVFFKETPPRFRKPVDPSALKKVWKMKKTKPFSNDDQLEGLFKGDSGSSVIAQKYSNLEGKTSVMIRNIPVKFRREELLRFLDSYCINHQLEYDFFYLPMDFVRHNNLGYAFVNFTTGTAAAKIMSLLDGYKWSASQTNLKKKQSKKVCQLNWAKIQGKEELVKHFQRSNFCCDENEYLPVVFSPPRNGSTCLSTPSTIGKLVGFRGPKRHFIRE